MSFIRRFFKIRRNEITDMADKLEPKLRREFVAGIKNIRKNVKLDDLTRILASGDVREFETLVLRDFAGNFTTMFLLLRQGLETAGKIEAARLAPKVSQSGFVFNGLNPNTVRFLNEYNFNLIRNLTNTTREGLRVVFKDAFTMGGHPRTQAKLIREMVGLTELQAASIVRATKLMREKNVNQSVIGKFVAKQTEKKIKQRAINIARSETIRALNTGQQMTWEQLAEQGLINRNTAQRRWIVADDDRLCPICESLDGALVGLDEEFSSTVQHSVTRTQTYTAQVPPIHPGCRCSIGLVFE